MSEPQPAQARRTRDACRVTVQGQGGFDVPRNDLLLLSALEQGIDYPHNCRVGVCASCKTRLRSGKVRPMIDFALSPLTNEELEQGYILACQSKVHSDLEIDVRLGHHAPLPVKTVPARVSAWRRLPGEVIDLRLRLDETLHYEAGQYCTLAVSGSFVRRSFSFYDAPPDANGAGEVGFLIKRLPGGRFSDWIWSEDRSGVKIWLEGPFGVMGVDDDDIDRDGLCVAGGTGLAPILSIVSDRLVRSAKARFTIVFGVRTEADDFAVERLQALAQATPGRVRVVTTLSHEPAGSGWRGPRGLVTDALNDDLGIDPAQSNAFVCGGLPMVEAVEGRLLAMGVPQARIHADKFVPTR